MSSPRRFYVVRGKAAHGSITHRCPTAELALDTLRRFERDAVRDVSLLDPDGLPLSPGRLEALATGTDPVALVEDA